MVIFQTFSSHTNKNIINLQKTGGRINKRKLILYPGLAKLVQDFTTPIER